MFDVFDLMATIKLDSSDYERGLSDAESKSSTFGDVLKANLVTKGIDVAINGFKQLGSMAVGVMQQSVNAYKEYEQLTGGVETLFGESADKVMEYADRAFQTAGMSANQYMETVTGFSASLLQSLGGDTAKAADVADQAIIDMSDNANKMGTSMESIQNAYQGFAKQNYTINLMSAA